MKYSIEIQKVNEPIGKGTLTHIGKVMDILLENNPLYYITQYPEKYNTEIPCGLWKDGRELQPIKLFLVSDYAEIEVDSESDVKILVKWLRGVRELEIEKDFILENGKISLLEYEQFVYESKI